MVLVVSRDPLQPEWSYSTDGFLSRINLAQTGNCTIQRIEFLDNDTRL